MKTKTACFTGHRKIPAEIEDVIYKRTKEEIIKLAKRGYIFFESGGALGFDTISARAVLDVKRDFPQIELILVLPCVTQTKYWSKKDMILHEKIKALAKNVIYTSEEYTVGCMHKRNRRLVDDSSACICYLTGESGGTFYTVSYAKRNSLEVINIAEKN